LLRGFLEHIGIEPGRLQFSWISSSEAGKFVDVASEMTARVEALGPATHLVKGKAKVA
jgi:coenzyme F420-reducing hydrogenase delta subunit